MPEPEEGLEQPEGTPETQPAEPVEGQPEGEGDEGTPAPEPKSEDTPQPPKYGGKTVEELAAELAEKDRVIASQFQDRAKQEHEASLLRAIAEAGAAPFDGRTAQTPPSAPFPTPPMPGAPGYGRPAIPPFDPTKVVTEEEYLANPIIATDKINQAREQYNRAVQSIYDRQRSSESAQGNFMKGRAEAIKQAPKLHAGIERVVEAEIVNSYRRNQLSADQLGDPRTWNLIAELVRRDAGELNFEKYYKSGPTPGTFTKTETPRAASAPAKPKVQLNAEQRQLVEMWGTPLDQFTKAYERDRS